VQAGGGNDGDFRMLDYQVFFAVLVRQKSVHERSLLIASFRGFRDFRGRLIFR
jgi:hypothetical protein